MRRCDFFLELAKELQEEKDDPEIIPYYQVLESRITIAQLTQVFFQAIKIYLPEIQPQAKMTKEFVDLLSKQVDSLSWPHRSQDVCINGINITKKLFESRHPFCQELSPKEVLPFKKMLKKRYLRYQPFFFTKPYSDACRVVSKIEKTLGWDDLIFDYLNKIEQGKKPLPSQGFTFERQMNFYHYIMNFLQKNPDAIPTYVIHVNKFAMNLLADLKRQNKYQSQDFNGNPVLFLEGKIAKQEIETILTKMSQLSGPLTIEHLQTLESFFKKRWERVCFTQGNYKVHLNDTPINLILRRMSQMIMGVSYLIHRPMPPHFDYSSILQPALTETSSNKKIKEYILTYLSTRNNLINLFLDLPRTQWKKWIDWFEHHIPLDKFIQIIFGNENSVATILAEKKNYKQDDEVYDRALLCCLLSLYKRSLTAKANVKQDIIMQDIEKTIEKSTHLHLNKDKLSLAIMLNFLCKPGKSFVEYQALVKQKYFAELLNEIKEHQYRYEDFNYNPFLFVEAQQMKKLLIEKLDAINNAEVLTEQHVLDLEGLLKNRWEYMGGSYAVYRDKLQENPLNLFCIKLAKQIVQVYHYMNLPLSKSFNEFDILEPVPKKDNDKALVNMIFDQFKSREDLINFFKTIPHRQWKQILLCLETFVTDDKFSHLFFDEEKNLKNIFAAHHLYQLKDVEYNRAFLCCLFSIYHRERMKKGETTSYLSDKVHVVSTFLHLKLIDTKEVKLAATEAIIDFMSDPNNSLQATNKLGMYETPLKRGTLKTFFGEIEKAANIEKEGARCNNPIVYNLSFN